MSKIVIEFADGSSLGGTRRVLESDRVTVGRLPDRNISFDPHADRLVSGCHAELRAEETGWIIEDVGSRNGTFVNTRRITGPHPLVGGDQVTLGDSGPEFVVELAQVDASKIGASSESARNLHRTAAARRRVSLAPEDLVRLRHGSEASRLWMALFGTVVALLALAANVWASGGLALFSIGTAILVSWATVEILRARLVGHAVRVDRASFPDLVAILDDLQRRVGVTKPVEVFIVDDGSVDAYLAKFFGTRYVVLTSGMMARFHDDDVRDQVEFVIGRFLGALAAKHFRASLPRAIISGAERVVFLYVFVLPYERAVQYTGDQIGLVLGGNLDAALGAMTRVMVGDELHAQISSQTLIEQASSVDGFLGTIARLGLPFPHMVHRYRNLLSFAQSATATRYSVPREKRLTLADRTLV